MHGSCRSQQVYRCQTVLPGNDSSEFTDVTALKGSNFRSEVKFNNLRNPKYNSGFCERQLVTTGDKTVTMFPPLSAVLGSHQDIDTVMIGVKDTYIIDRRCPTTISIKLLLQLQVLPHSAFVLIDTLGSIVALCADAIEGFARIRRSPRSLYFEQVRVYRNQFGATELSPTWRVTSIASEQLPQHVFVALASVKQEGELKQNNQVFNKAKPA